MYARILEFVPLMEKKDEFIRVVKKEVLPILKKQEGFLPRNPSPLCPRSGPKKYWRSLSGPTRRTSKRNEQEWSPRVEQILKPYLANPPVRKLYTLETTLCEHFSKRH